MTLKNKILKAGITLGLITQNLTANPLTIDFTIQNLKQKPIFGIKIQDSKSTNNYDFTNKQGKATLTIPQNHTPTKPEPHNTPKKYTLNTYNILGQKINTQQTTTTKPTTIKPPKTNQNGKKLPQGIYILQLQNQKGQTIQTTKTTLTNNQHTNKTPFTTTKQNTQKIHKTTNPPEYTIWLNITGYAIKDTTNKPIKIQDDNHDNKTQKTLTLNQKPILGLYSEDYTRQTKIDTPTNTYISTLINDNPTKIIPQKIQHQFTQGKRDTLEKKITAIDTKDTTMKDTATLKLIHIPLYPTLTIKTQDQTKQPLPATITANQKTKTTTNGTTKYQFPPKTHITYTLKGNFPTTTGQLTLKNDKTIQKTLDKTATWTQKQLTINLNTNNNLQPYINNDQDTTTITQQPDTNIIKIQNQQIKLTNTTPTQNINLQTKLLLTENQNTDTLHTNIQRKTYTLKGTIKTETDTTKTIPNTTIQIINPHKTITTQTNQNGQYQTTIYHTGHHDLIIKKPNQILTRRTGITKNQNPTQTINKTAIDTQNTQLHTTELQKILNKVYRHNTNNNQFIYWNEQQGHPHITMDTTEVLFGDNYTGDLRTEQLLKWMNEAGQLDHKYNLTITDNQDTWEKGKFKQFYRLEPKSGASGSIATLEKNGMIYSAIATYNPAEDFTGFTKATLYEELLSGLKGANAQGPYGDLGKKTVFGSGKYDTPLDHLIWKIRENRRNQGFGRIKKTNEQWTEDVDWNYQNIKQDLQHKLPKPKNQQNTTTYHITTINKNGQKTTKTYHNKKNIPKKHQHLIKHLEQ